MRTGWLGIFGLAFATSLCARNLQAQTLPASYDVPSSTALTLHLRQPGDEVPDGLPDAPSAVLAANPVPCKPPATTEAEQAEQARQPRTVPCAPESPYHRFLNSKTPVPLTPLQKGKLALHSLRDPFNALTIVGNAAYTIGSNPRTAYGPGLKGFGKDIGYSYLQDATGEFFGTFAIPSVTHEDPHYHRMPHASIPRRLLHAVSRTVIAESDYGRSMPNYSTLLGNPICAEISNLYVPGVATNGPSTMKRIVTGYATDPIGNVITEFLPDVASHIHIQILFVQRILNQVAAPSNNSTGSTGLP
ncbi:hypothetical protein SAMN05421770_101276 [Granulicella rosea]|uniref:Uncharacterized protein n=1 Tax=Granulicella rosea TaxID=474952 RepID=A0A239D626_9BACT|nr:hypothetical protein [Granulicella rosea]SNS27033.1 hypothetical protein SAMN05421770_101276 [Granulicella rosea]